jgi:2-polyprenyl-3-methyl-5-hydroxy-6-metoxy-1,4-benzoquinol methylase
MTESIYTKDYYTQSNPTGAIWKAEQVVKMIEKHSLPLYHVCEIGCGAGQVLRHIQSRLPKDAEFYGYDTSPDAIALCKSIENEHLHFSCKDLLSNGTECFDVLLCLDVVEHVEDYMGFLRKLQPRAKYKIFHFPLDLTAQTIARRSPIVGARTQTGHLHYFFKETALFTLKDTGYEILDWFYTAGHVGLAQTARTKLARLPRETAFRLSPDLAVPVLGGYQLLVLAK